MPQCVPESHESFYYTTVLCVRSVFLKAKRETSLSGWTVIHGSMCSRVWKGCNSARAVENGHHCPDSFTNRKSICQINWRRSWVAGILNICEEGKCKDPAEIHSTHAHSKKKKRWIKSWVHVPKVRVQKSDGESCLIVQELAVLR